MNALRQFTDGRLSLPRSLTYWPMRSIAIAVALFGLFSQASAEPYVVISGGPSSYRWLERGPPLESEKNKLGFRAAAGYRFDSNFALEISHIQFGTNSLVTFRRSNGDPLGFIRTRIKGTGLGASYHFALPSNFEASIRVSALYTKQSRYAGSYGSGDRYGFTPTHSVEPHLGLSLAHRLSDDWLASLSYDIVRSRSKDVDVSVHARLASLGVTYEF